MLSMIERHHSKKLSTFIEMFQGMPFIFSRGHVADSWFEGNHKGRTVFNLCYPFRLADKIFPSKYDFDHVVYVADYPKKDSQEKYTPNTLFPADIEYEENKYYHHYEGYVLWGVCPNPKIFTGQGLFEMGPSEEVLNDYFGKPRIDKDTGIILDLWGNEILRDSLVFLDVKKTEKLPPEICL